MQGHSGPSRPGFVPEHAAGLEIVGDAPRVPATQHRQIGADEFGFGLIPHQAPPSSRLSGESDGRQIRNQASGFFGESGNPSGSQSTLCCGIAEQGTQSRLAMWRIPRPQDRSLIQSTPATAISISSCQTGSARRLAGNSLLSIPGIMESTVCKTFGSRMLENGTAARSNRRFHGVGS